MPGRMKSSEPSVTIIPNETAQNISEERWHPKRPRLLTVLFSILALIAMVHFMAVAHQSEIVVTPNTCPGLLQNTDYTNKYISNRKHRIWELSKWLISLMVDNQQHW